MHLIKTSSFSYWDSSFPCDLEGHSFWDAPVERVVLTAGCLFEWRSFRFVTGASVMSQHFQIKWKSIHIYIYKYIYIYIQIYVYVYVYDHMYIYIYLTISEQHCISQIPIFWPTVSIHFDCGGNLTSFASTTPFLWRWKSCLSCVLKWSPPFSRGTKTIDRPDFRSSGYCKYLWVIGDPSQEEFIVKVDLSSWWSRLHPCNRDQPNVELPWFHHPNMLQKII